MGKVSCNAESMVKLLRTINHDYLNHFQVISGYLQMGRAQQALLYLKDAVETIQHRGSLLRWIYPTTVLLLLQWQSNFRERGRILGIECETDLKEIGITDGELNELLTLILATIHSTGSAVNGETWMLKVFDDLDCYVFEVSSIDANWHDYNWEMVEVQIRDMGYRVESIRDAYLQKIRCIFPKKTSWLVAE